VTDGPAARLQALGLSLPPPFSPVATYEPLTQAGGVVRVSGQGPVWGTDIRYKGKVGRDLSATDAGEAARLTMLNILSHLDRACGLGRIARPLSIFGLVNTDPAFADLGAVIDPASDLLMTLFGADQPHTRTVVAASALPFDIAVEIDGAFQLRPDGDR